MINSLGQLEHVFVYGTLKRGQCRQACWPVDPVNITEGWITGTLIDLGPYPALLEGSDRIWGELWSFEASDIEAVHRRLDLVEVYNQPGLSDEYQRVRINVRLHSAAASLLQESVWASTYRFVAFDSTQQLRPMPASLTIDGDSYVVWPARM